MKILFAPLITRLKINESQERIKMLARESMKRGHQVALSVNGCCNYSKIKGTTVYEAPMPKNWKSSRIKQKSGKESLPKDWLYLVENMHSFSDALYVMGAIGKKYYKKDVEAIINAIDKFNPDIVYSDLRPAAVSASLIRNIKIASTVTYPLCEYHSQDPYALDIINSYNSKMDIVKSKSFCAFYENSNLEFVPSIYELQPLAGKSVVFAGPIMEFKPIDKIVPAKKIIIKLRSMDQDFLLKETIKAFKNLDLKIILVSSKLEDKDYGNISVRKNINMKKQLAEAAVYIHNGENKDLFNSIISETPQIIVKTNVYFLKYNGYSIQRNNAGLFIEESDFNKNRLPKLIDKIINKDKYVENTQKLSKILMEHKGAITVIDEIEKLLGI
jgi:ribosomal protein L30E